MEFEKIERMAAAGESLGETDSVREHACWQALRMLYVRYRAHGISKERAAAEKRRIRGAFVREETNDETRRALQREWVNNVRMSEPFRAELHKAATGGADAEQLLEIACKCIAAMTGDATVETVARMERAG